MKGAPEEPRHRRCAREVSEWLRKVSGQLGADAGGVVLAARPGRRDRPGQERGPRKVEEYVLSPETELVPLGQKVAEDAYREGEGSGNGVHAFVLFAYRTEEDAHFASKSFQVHVTTAPEAGQDGDDEQDSRSLLGQSYRHIEKMAEIGLDKDRAIFAAQTMTIDALTGQLNQFYGTMGQMFTAQMEIVKTKGEVEQEKAWNDVKNEVVRAAGLKAIEVAPKVGTLLARKYGLLEPDEELEERAPEPPPSPSPPRIPARVECRAPVEYAQVIDLKPSQLGPGPAEPSHPDGARADRAPAEEPPKPRRSRKRGA